jgi:hypothetical protein
MRGNCSDWVDEGTRVDLKKPEDEIARLGPPLPEQAPTPTSASQAKPVQPGPDGTRGRVKPVEGAEGDHSTYKRGPDGQVTKTASYKQNPQNPSGFDETQRTDTAGKSHYNKATKQDVPTPHVHDPTAPGGVWPAQPHEIPKPPLPQQPTSTSKPIQCTMPPNCS